MAAGPASSTLSVQVPENLVNFSFVGDPRSYPKRLTDRFYPWQSIGFLRRAYYCAIRDRVGSLRQKAARYLTVCRIDLDSIPWTASMEVCPGLWWQDWKDRSDSCSHDDLGYIRLVRSLVVCFFSSRLFILTSYRISRLGRLEAKGCRVAATKRKPPERKENCRFALLRHG